MKTTSKADAGRSAAREEPEAEREMVVSRRIGAPREVVFEAFTSAERLARWWGPDGFRTTTSRFELRPGGKWIFVMHGPDGTDYPNENVYREVAPPERLAYAHVSPPEHEVVATFEDEGERTRVTMRMTFASAALRDEVARRFGAVEGMQQNLERLGEALRAVRQAG